MEDIIKISTRKHLVMTEDVTYLGSISSRPLECAITSHVEYLYDPPQERLGGLLVILTGTV